MVVTVVSTLNINKDESNLCDTGNEKENWESTLWQVPKYFKDKSFISHLQIKILLEKKFEPKI